MVYSNLEIGAQAAYNTHHNSRNACLIYMFNKYEIRVRYVYSSYTYNKKAPNGNCEASSEWIRVMLVLRPWSYYGLIGRGSPTHQFKTWYNFSCSTSIFSVLLYDNFSMLKVEVTRHSSHFFVMDEILLVAGNTSTNLCYLLRPVRLKDAQYLLYNRY